MATATTIPPETDYTSPGIFAQRLYNEYGADRFRRVPLNVPAWIVLNDKPARVVIADIHSASGCGDAADYVELADGRRVATFYLFPTTKHCKPRLATVHDGYGACQQWIAPVRPGVLRKW